MSTPGDVIVCGAGVIGASVAYLLVRRGVRVTVVERSGVACAASGKSGRFLALDWCDGSPLGLPARASFALHADLAPHRPGQGLPADDDARHRAACGDTRVRGAISRREDFEP